MEGTDSRDPYDDVPYRSYPIQWTAPERLAVTSALHGGPRPPLAGYRVLELGCGNGANLLPLAFYRRHGTFVGVDGARSQVDIARSWTAQLGLTNVEWLHADFVDAKRLVSGEFDYIIAHGVLSWVPTEARDALLRICSRHLRPDGLLYLNYNCRPGWNVRGLVRDILRSQTAETQALAERARRAIEVAATMASSLEQQDHPYAQLMAGEFRLVSNAQPSYVAHEYLATHNRAYWRSEFLALAGRHGLDWVADADFNLDAGRVDDGLAEWLTSEGITGRSGEDAADLLTYRQLHSPILARRPLHRTPLAADELAELRVASPLAPTPRDRTDPPEGAGEKDRTDTTGMVFRHPSGFEVESTREDMRAALIRLADVWPRSLPVGSLFPSLDVEADLRLLQRSGLIELRCVEPGDFGVDGAPLNALESRAGGYVTTPYHAYVLSRVEAENTRR